MCHPVSTEDGIILESEGKADKIEGKVQNAIGGVKDTVKDVLKGK